MKHLEWLKSRIQEYKQIESVQVDYIANEDMFGISIVIKWGCGFECKEIFDTVKEAKAYLSGVYLATPVF